MPAFAGMTGILKPGFLQGDICDRMSGNFAFREEKMSNGKTDAEIVQQAINDARSGLLPDPMAGQSYYTAYNRVMEQQGLDDARNGLFPRSNANTYYMASYNNWKQQNEKQG